MRVGLRISLLAGAAYLLTCGQVFACEPWPDTGQSKCYDAAGGEINCDGSVGYPGQDGFYNGPARSTTDNDDGTVTDNVTGLMWQQDGSVSGLKSLGEIEAYLATLNSPTTGLAGHTDWRLPTAQELSSLVDSGFTYVGLSDQSYGDFTLAAEYNPSYWTSDPALDSPELGLDCGTNDRIVLLFRHGTVFNSCDPDIPLTSNHILAVRSDPSPAAPAFVDRGDGTVLDNNTGLMWQKVHATSTGVVNNSFPWGAADACDETPVNALCYCDSLELGGYDDWRLPNRNEMHSIFDYANNPALAAVFVGEDTLGKFVFWTSTSNNDDPAKAWTAGPIESGFLRQVGDKATRTNHVRCVRDEKKGMNILLMIQGVLASPETR